MKRIKWRLTLWWRTVRYGPYCVRCEERHGKRLPDLHWCDFVNRFEANTAEILRLQNERARLP